ncbi:MAG: isoleucine--tRNA ligase [Runella sp.]
MNYKEYKGLDYAQVGAEMLQFWKENHIFEQSIAVREGAPSFTFYEGPPSANGTPGIHHVMARTIKDIFCRYKTLRGYQVKRKGGWDTHGLPIELQVEKELGIKKDDIGVKISVEEYNQKCREAVMRYTDLWQDMTDKMGYWVDMNDPYITYKNEYIESLWWLLKQLYEKDLLYKGYTIQPYSPAAGTGLSSHELNQPGTYKEVKDTSIVAQFKVKLTGKSGYLFDVANSDNIYILAWTTTPWTLPANSALTVGKDIDYVLIKTFNPYTYLPINVVLAKNLVGRWFNDKGKDGDFATYKDGDKVIPWKILMELKGEHLEGIEYEQLLPYIQPLQDADKAFRVILGDFVTTEDGTGIVHTSPTFGADDFRVAKANGVPPIMVRDETGKEVPIVDRTGRFVKEMGEFGGKFVKEQYYSDEQQNDPNFKPTDVLIAIKLKEENKAFRVEKYEHTYPHCWRTDKPILYYPLDSWFIATTKKKERLVELNKTINWQPESTGTGRFGNWLENLVDWNLSRSRYWGTPLPIWRSDDGQEKCIGSVKELIQELQKANDSGMLSLEEVEKNNAFIQSYHHSTFDLHRPYVDEIFLVSETGKPMYREPDLIDVWFDSGAMPYAQWHYPFSKTSLENVYPADFISEGVDQTRGWFFTLHAIAGLLFDSVAFKNVVSTGLVLDKNGNKMSKRLGNAINPFETLAKYGPDATRWYMITNAEPWDNLKFNLDGVVEVQRKFFGTLFNTYNFFALYANLDNYKIEQFDRVPKEHLTELDRWIISRIYTLVKEVGEAYDDYNPTKAGRLIQDFVCDDLSNWYVRLNRRRFWKTPQTPNGQSTITPLESRAAFETLQHALCAVAQLMSPIAPFFADWLYRNMTQHIREESIQKNTPFRHESVHFTDWHTFDPNWIDTDLEQSMKLAQDVCSLVHSLRKAHKIKVRQPLTKILIPVLSANTRQQIERTAAIIMSEVNVKAVEFVDDDSGILKKKIKPNFKVLGPKYGKDMKAVAEFINSLSADQIKALETTGTLQTDAPIASFTHLLLEDVEIIAEDVPGWLVASQGNLTVALDITITDDLRREGIARDVVNRIQNLRKDMGFEVVDKINIKIENNDADLAEAIKANQQYISQEVQALSLEVVGQLEGTVNEMEMDELLLRLEIEKA